jgi:hypothetical protein
MLPYPAADDKMSLNQIASIDHQSGLDGSTSAAKDGHWLDLTARRVI